MTWAKASDAGPMSPRVLTPEESAEVNDVLDAAHAFANGEMPWHAAASIGDGRLRGLATVTTDRHDPRWTSLMRLLDVLIDASGHVRTNHGIYSNRQLGEYDVAVHIHPREDHAA